MIPSVLLNGFFNKEIGEFDKMSARGLQFSLINIILNHRLFLTHVKISYIINNRLADEFL